MATSTATSLMRQEDGEAKMPDNETRTRPAQSDPLDSPWDADPADVAEQARPVVPDDETSSATADVPGGGRAREADDADVVEQSIAVPADPDEARG